MDNHKSSIDRTCLAMNTMSAVSRGLIKSIRIRVTLAAAELSVMLMLACAPMTISFYRPETAARKVVKACCSSVHSVILFEAHDVIIGFEVSAHQKDRVRTTITFEIPEKLTVRLVDRFVEIYGSSGVSSKSELFGRVWVSAGRSTEIPLDKPMEGNTRKRMFDQVTRYGKTEHAYYSLDAEMAVVLPDKFSLKPSGFLVNGLQVNLPVITFLRTTESYVG